RCRPLFHNSRHRDEVFIIEEQLTEWISDVRIEACRNDDKVWAEPGGDLVNRRFNPTLVFSRWCCSPERKVYRVAQPSASSSFSTRTCSGIPGILMSGEKEDRRIVVEDPLRSISVVYIPIDNCHSLNLPIFVLSISSSNGYIVE